MTLRGHKVPIAFSLLIWCLLWEAVGRLGLIRGLKGVIIGQLLIAVVGMGYLFELYSRSFLMAEFWALLILLFASAFLASEAVAYFERKVSFYATAR